MPRAAAAAAAAAAAHPLACTGGSRAHSRGRPARGRRVQCARRRRLVHALLALSHTHAPRCSAPPQTRRPAPATSCLEFSTAGRRRRLRHHRRCHSVARGHSGRRRRCRRRRRRRRPAPARARCSRRCCSAASGDECGPPSSSSGWLSTPGSSSSEWGYSAKSVNAPGAGAGGGAGARRVRVRWLNAAAACVRCSGAPARAAASPARPPLARLIRRPACLAASHGPCRRPGAPHCPQPAAYARSVALHRWRTRVWKAVWYGRCQKLAAPGGGGEWLGAGCRRGGWRAQLPRHPPRRARPRAPGGHGSRQAPRPAHAQGRVNGRARGLPALLPRRTPSPAPRRREGSLARSQRVCAAPRGPAPRRRGQAAPAAATTTALAETRLGARGAAGARAAGRSGQIEAVGAGGRDGAYRVRAQDAGTRTAGRRARPQPRRPCLPAASQHVPAVQQAAPPGGQPACGSWYSRAQMYGARARAQARHLPPSPFAGSVVFLPSRPKPALPALSHRARRYTLRLSRSRVPEQTPAAAG